MNEDMLSKLGEEEPLIEQAPEPLTLSDRMMKLFGSPDVMGPEQFLKKAGYKLTPSKVWIPKPGVARVDDMAEDEVFCFRFLLEDHGYGGLSGITTGRAPEHSA